MSCSWVVREHSELSGVPSSWFPNLDLCLNSLLGVGAFDFNLNVSKKGFSSFQARSQGV